MYSTVQCEQCKDRIEKYLTREEGVQKVTVDFKRRPAKLPISGTELPLKILKTAIANIGYDAGDVTADPEVYKNCPHVVKA
jgi:copper chaperone CopZ